MRKVTVGLIFGLILLFSSPFTQSNQTLYQVAETQDIQEQSLTRTEQQQEDDLTDTDDQDDLFYEREIFSRKLFQKDLPPMTKKEKIIWAFRMAASNPFL